MARPDVLNHNTETIARLYRRVRPDAKYAQTLEFLERSAYYRDTQFPQMLTKSGIMAGLGEEFEEVVELMKDLRRVDCNIMTIGQYLQPYERRLPVERYVTPEEFAEWKRIGLSLGFKHVESSPLTRQLSRATADGKRRKRERFRRIESLKCRLLNGMKKRKNQTFANTKLLSRKVNNFLRSIFIDDSDPDHSLEEPDLLTSEHRTKIRF